MDYFNSNHRTINGTSVVECKFKPDLSQEIDDNFITINNLVQYNICKVFSEGEIKEFHLLENFMLSIKNYN